MRPMKDLLSYTFLDNTVLNWGLAGLAFLFTFLVIPFVRRVVRKHHRLNVHTNRSAALELLGLLMAKTSRLVLLILALYLAEQILKLPAKVDRVFDIVIIVGAWIQVGIWATVALRFTITRRSGTDPAAATSISILMFAAQLILWAVFVLLALDNLGVNITALVAGLGVGGIAVALAVQTLLGDLFGSLSIAFDKPFAVGDSLKIDDIEGTVEHIGLKSTRLRAVTGEQVIIANADVLKSRVRNLGRMPERRMLFKLLVAYDTAPDKLDAIPSIVAKAVQAQPGTRFVQCLLNSLGDYALEFETIYFVQNKPDYPLGKIVDAINRGILREFAGAGVEFAYPTQRLRFEGQFPPGQTPAQGVSTPGHTEA
jgi:small-conductance mechanosensitive channel